MKTLAGRAGDGMTKELYDHLLELGPQSANLVKACTEMTKPQLEEYARSFSATSGEAVEASTEELSAISANWENAGQEIAQKAGEAGEKSGKEHTEKAKKRDRIRPEGSHGGGQERRRGSRKRVAESNRGRNPAEFRAGVTGAGNSMKNAADTARTYRSSFESVGQSMSEGVAVGINRDHLLYSNAVNSVLQSAVNEAEKK